MFAIIEVDALQIKVAEGDQIDVYRAPEEVGNEVTFDKVLLFAKGSDVRVGQPYLKDVTVTAKVLGHHASDRVVAFKYRRRKNSAKKIGYRQKLTALNITKISA